MPYIIPRTDPRKITADDLKKNKVLALDISGSVSKYLSEHKGQALSIGHIMSFTQAAWKLAPEKANDVDLWNRYVGLMLGPVKHGEANPVRYYESSNI